MIIPKPNYCNFEAKYKFKKIELSRNAWQMWNKENSIYLIGNQAQSGGRGGIVEPRGKRVARACGDLSPRQYPVWYCSFKCIRKRFENERSFLKFINSYNFSHKIETGFNEICKEPPLRSTLSIVFFLLGTYPQTGLSAGIDNLSRRGGSQINTRVLLLHLSRGKPKHYSKCKRTFLALVGVTCSSGSRMSMPESW